MLVIGLTGGIGSGKSTVAKLFSEKGVTVIDTDQLARDVTAPGKPALKELEKKFGNEILLPTGKLDRTRLRKIVFSDAEKRIWLEKLLHPLIRQEMKTQIDSSSSDYVIVVIPLLFETEPNPLINRVLVVDTTEKNQISRTQKRDNMTIEEVQAVLASQAARTDRLKGANDIVHNDGTINELLPQINKLHDFYNALAKK